LAGFVLDRDTTDHFRFAPIQTKLAQKLCQDYDAPSDVSTAVLIDEQGKHTHSTAVLRLLLRLGALYKYLSLLALWGVPRFLRDAAYSAVAAHRGRIWTAVKKVTGMGDTSMVKYRGRILGLEEPADPSWGFETTTRNSAHEQ